MLPICRSTPALVCADSAPPESGCSCLLLFHSAQLFPLPADPLEGTSLLAAHILPPFLDSTRPSRSAARYPSLASFHNHPPRESLDTTSISGFSILYILYLKFVLYHTSSNSTCLPTPSCSNSDRSIRALLWAGKNTGGHRQVDFSGGCGLRVSASLSPCPLHSLTKPPKNTTYVRIMILPTAKTLTNVSSQDHYVRVCYA